MLFTKEDFASWKQNNITRKFFEQLEKDRKNILEDMVADSTPYQESYQTFCNISHGKIEAIDAIISTMYEDLLVEEGDE